MATQTGSYDFKAAKAAHDEASQTASNYITEINNDGIMVHAEGDGPDDTQTPSGWHISDVLEYIRQGVSRFWIGLKNQGDSTPTVRIGKEIGESRMELDYHSLKMMDKEGNEYLHISDLRVADGTFELTENFAANYADYVIALVPSEVISVMVDDVSVGYTLTIYEDLGYARIRLDNPAYPQSGSIVSVRYKTTSGNAKAYTLGTRKANANIGAMSYAEGKNVESSGYISHAEGMNTVASDRCSHAEGDGTKATSLYCHAEGSETIASDWASHAEGMNTVASGVASHAGGSFTVAAGLDQTAIGRCNVEDANDTYAVIVGNGTNDSNRSNALTVDWGGGTTLWSGNLEDGTAPSENTNGSGRISMVDSRGAEIGYAGPRYYANGRLWYDFGVRREVNGSTVSHGASLGIDESGNRYVSILKGPWLSALGFADSAWTTQYDSGPAVSVANSSWVKLTQITLTEGHWLVLVGGYAASNSTGRRGFHLASTSSVTTSRFLSVIMAPPSGSALYTVIPYMVKPTANTTYNIFGYQNSGGNLNMSALVRAIHIHTV